MKLLRLLSFVLMALSSLAKAELFVEVLNPKGEVEAAFSVESKSRLNVKDFDSTISFHETDIVAYPLDGKTRKPNRQRGIGTRIEISQAGRNGPIYKFKVKIDKVDFVGFVEASGPSAVYRIPNLNTMSIDTSVDLSPTGNGFELGAGWLVRIIDRKLNEN